MVITPQNEIVLLNLPIEIDNKNQLSFANANAQFQYFRFQQEQRQYDNLAFLYANSGVQPIEFPNNSNSDVPKVVAADFINLKGDINV